MVAAVSLVAPETSDGWLVRSYDPERDENALHYLLGVAYSRSRAGARAGASRAGGSRSLSDRQSGVGPSQEQIAAQRAFLAAHSPIWTWLLEHATVTLAVDPEQAHIIWAWLVTSEPNVIHAVGCKRSLIEAGVAVDVVSDLLGERLRKHQVCSLELPQMRTRGDGLGLDRPDKWSLDPTWLLTRMRP